MSVLNKTEQDSNGHFTFVATGTLPQVRATGNVATGTFFQ